MVNYLAQQGDWSEKFCPRCRTVSITASVDCRNCNKPFEIFDPCVHGTSLIGPANSWAQIQGKWDDHPIFEEVSQALYDDGCCGAASHINAFIRTLLDMIEDSAMIQELSDYEQSMADQPLWSLAMHAGESTPGTRRDAFAAELRVIIDWIVPEDDRMILSPTSQSGEYFRWLERKRLREMLLAEADRAEQVDEYYLRQSDAI